LISMAPLGAPWRVWWTVQRLSHIIADVTFLLLTIPNLIYNII
jgi:hypothetical protein